MSDESPVRQAPPTKAPRPTRRLSFPSRVRGSLRRAADRVLGADAAWSAAFIAVVVLLLGLQRCAPARPTLVEGELAPADVVLPADIRWIDHEATERLRREARDAVPAVYIFDRDKGSRLSRRLASIFEQGRRAQEEAFLRQQDVERAVRRELGERVPADALATLIALRLDPAIERELTGVLLRTLELRIVANRDLLEHEERILLVQEPGNLEELVEQFSGFVDLGEAQQAVRREVAERLELGASAERALGDLTATWVDSNVYSDAEATQRRRQEAADRVPPVDLPLSEGDLIIPRGQRVSREALEQLERSSAASRANLSGSQWLGLIFLAAMLAFFLYRYCSYHQRAFRKIRHLHSLLVLMMLSMLLLARAILWVAANVVDALDHPFSNLHDYTYLIPLGAGAILVALLANGRIATVYAAFTSLLFGAMNGWDAYLMLWGMLVQFAGVYAISTYRERSALLRAGFVVGGAGAAAAAALESVRGNLQPAESLYALSLAFVGGAVGVGLVISFSLPMLESLYNVLTDIRLLELSNVNHPLLSELAVKAPGSYNHSLIVGTLAEEASRAIGANSLFCRVAAFYHDVGKMNKPEYFVENQRGVNPHDRLAPSMSALIIASHVKDGIKLAREAGLPEQIVDIIPQHHGTKLMTYFYEKAKSSADPELPPVKREDFRYPGPKPQTREAAIFMLADAAEAAARTIDDPTANRLKEMIRKVTNAIVIDGQLHSCDLTFADLEKIQNAFLRTLVSMYHHRVDYPGFDFRRPRGEARPEARPRAAHEAERADKEDEVAATKLARGS